MIFLIIGAGLNTWSNIKIKPEDSIYLISEDYVLMINKKEIEIKIEIEFKDNKLVIRRCDKLIFAIQKSSKLSKLSWINGFKYFGFSNWRLLHKF